MSAHDESHLSGKYPAVSVIVPNFNGSRYIGKYMRSLFETDYPNLEIVFVDDGSTDDSLAILTQQFGRDPRLKIVKHPTNKGLAVARNSGIRASKGMIVAFLDTDIEVDPGWLEPLVHCLVADESVAVAMSKTLDMYDRNRIQCVGQIFIPYLGWTFLKGYGETDNGQYDNMTEVFACLNAAAVKKEIFTEVGLIDERMTYLWEDLDFEWRVLVHGMKEVLVPHSVVYHLSKAPQKRPAMYKWNFLSADFFSRDIVRFFLKNYELGNSFRYLIASAYILTFRLFLALRRRDLSVPFGMVASGVVQLRLLRDTLQERRRVQQHVRRISDFEILRKFGIRGSPLHIYRQHRRILAASDEFYKKSVMEGKRDLD